MTDMTETFLCLAAVAVIGWATYNIGNLVGQKRACESVKMEWVKDKCMKVIREEMK